MTDGGIADAIIANAPAHEHHFFLVPKVVEYMCLACEQDAIWLAYLDSQGLLKPDDPAAVEALFGAFPVQPLPVQARMGRADARSAGRYFPPRRSRLPKKSIFLRRSDGRMTDLTSLTLAQARDALRREEFSATELADAHLAAMAKARALNAFVLETPERARAMARAVGRAAGERRGRSARRPAARHQGSVLHRRRAHDGLLAHSRQFRSDL